MSTELLGCCGAYCKTCKVYIENLCKGCKVGYVNGERDIIKAKCKMKVCCVKHGLTSCADCKDFESCETLMAFFGHDGYKYGKYHEALVFIRTHGYEVFFRVADGWKNAYGRYDDRE